MVNNFRERLLGSTCLNPLWKFDFTSLFFKERVDNITNEENNELKETLEFFEERISRSDEIPEVIIHVIHNWSMKWKVRKNWWMSILGSLEVLTLRRNKLIKDDELRVEIKLFVKKFSQTHPDTPNITYFSQRLTTREDINEANYVLWKVIAYLKWRLEPK